MFLQVGQECVELDREIQRVEKESASIDHSAASIDEALQLHEKHSMHPRCSKVLSFLKLQHFFLFLFLLFLI